MNALQDRSPLSEINVTPMVDVMLVLLVVFMVAAPLLDKGINVILPKAETGKRTSSAGILLTLTREHVVYFNDAVVTLQELRAALSKLSPGQPVMIRADGSAYVSRLIALWDLCRDVGFSQIHIITMSE